MSSQPGRPASPRQNAHGQSQRRAVVPYSVWWPSAQSMARVPAARSAWMLGRCPFWRRSVAHRKSVRDDGRRRRPRSKGPRHPGPSAGGLAGRPRLSCTDVARHRRTPQALRRCRRPRRHRLPGRAGRGVRLPRRQRGGQDDDDADRPRHPRGRRRHGPVERPADRRAAAPHVGLPAGGARALQPDDGPRPARLLRRALRRRPADRPPRGPRLAGAVPRPRVRRPPGRAALEGQPAEGPVHRRDPPRPGRPHHGRALHRPRPGQRRPPQGGVHRDAGPRQDPHLQHPPDGPRRGAGRLDRDRRSGAGRRRRSTRRHQAGVGTADDPHRGGRRPRPRLARGPARLHGRPDGARLRRGRARRGGRPAGDPRRGPRARPGHPLRAGRSERRGDLHRACRPAARRGRAPPCRRPATGNWRRRPRRSRPRRGRALRRPLPPTPAPAAGGDR